MKKYPIEVEETRQINRITIKQSVLDLLNAFNIERGLIYTLKLLFVNPGKIVNLYLFEGRYKIVNAFRLLILSTAASLFVMYLVGADDFLLEFEKGFNESIADKELGDPVHISELMAEIFFDWYNLFLWIAIPIYGFFAMLFFPKKGYNFAENIVIQSFYICALNVLTILIFPLHHVFGLDLMVFLSFSFSTAYFIFFIIKVFKVTNLRAIIRTVLLFIISNVVYFLALGFILGIFVGLELESLKE